MNASHFARVALLLFLSLPALVQADTPARLMPETAVAYLEVSKAGTVADRLLDERLHAMLSRSSGYTAYVESDGFAKLQVAVSAVESQLGRKWPQIVRDLSGSWYFCHDPASESALLMIKPTRPETLAELQSTLQQMVEADAATRGKPSPVQSKEYEGVTGWTFGPNEFHSQIDGMLVVSNKADALKRVVDRLKDSTATGLAGTAEFKQAREHVASGECAWGFARLDAVRKLPKVQKVLEGKSSNAVAELLLGGLLDAARNAPVVVTSLHTDGDKLQLRTSVPYDVTKDAGARRWFFGDAPSAAALPNLRPKGTLVSLTIFRGVSAMWTQREELFDEATAARMAQADTNLGLYFGGSDFGGSILGQLSPRMQLVVARQEFKEDQTVPALKLPGAAIVLQMNEPDKFQNTLLLAFQKVIGLANLVGGQAGKPQLLLGSEQFHEVAISKAEFLTTAGQSKKDAAVYYNASPACARVGDRFIFSTTTQLTRDLIDLLKSPDAARPTKDNTRVELDPQVLASALDDNRESLISQNMLKEGHTREEAERDVTLVLEGLRSLKNASLRLAAEEKAIVFEVTTSVGK